MGGRPRTTPEAKAELRRRLNRESYHRLKHDPEWAAKKRDQVRLRAAARLARIRKDPVAYAAWKEQQKRYTSARTQRRRRKPIPDPDFGSPIYRLCFLIALRRYEPVYERKSKASRESHDRWYAQVKSDPEKYARYKRYCNDLHRRHYRQKLDDPETGIQYRQRHRKRVREYFKRPHARAMENARMQIRRYVCPTFRIAENVRRRLNISMPNGRPFSKHTFEIVGCSAAELMAHLEQQFEPGMSWGNYGHGDEKWNIDHIKPCAAHNLNDEVEVLACFHYSNLRPVWSNANYEKSSMWNGRLWRYADHVDPSPRPLT